MNTGSSSLKPYWAKRNKRQTPFQPNLSCKHFRIDYKRIEGISVFCVRYLKEKRPDWYFRINIPSINVLFFTLNKHNELVIIDEQNNLYHYHCQYQVCLSHQHFYSDYPLRIQADKDHLYLLADGERSRYSEGEEPEDYDSRNNAIYKYDYHKGKVIHEARVDDLYELVSNHYQNDDPWGFWLKDKTLYLSCSDYAHSKADYPGFAMVDYSRKKAQTTEVCFSQPILSRFHPEPKLFLFKHYGIAVRPNYKIPEFVKPNDGSEPYIPYTLELIDIQTGQIITDIELFRLTQKQLEDLKPGLTHELSKAAEVFKRYKKQADRIAQGAKLTQPEYPDRKYLKTINTFHNSLDNIIFFPQLGKDIKKTLLLTKKHMGFIAKVRSEKYIKVAIIKSNIEVTELNTQQALALESNLEEQQRVRNQSNKTPFIPPEILISNIIEINEWSLTNAKSALQQYLKLLQKNVNALIIDNEINVIIRLGYNQRTKRYLGKLDTEAFFARLKEYKQDVAIELQELIEWFCQYPKSDRLYHDCETTFLAYAMQHLLSLGEQYQALYLRYLKGVDMDHDVVNNEMCGEILAGDDWNENKLRFLVAMRDVGGQHFYHEIFERWSGASGALKKYVTSNHTIESFAELLEPIFKHDLENLTEMLEEDLAEAGSNHANDDQLTAALKLISKRHSAELSQADEIN